MAITNSWITSARRLLVQKESSLKETVTSVTMHASSESYVRHVLVLVFCVYRFHCCLRGSILKDGPGFSSWEISQCEINLILKAQNISTYLRHIADKVQDCRAHCKINKFLGGRGGVREDSLVYWPRNNKIERTKQFWWFCIEILSASYCDYITHAQRVRLWISLASVHHS